MVISVPAIDRQRNHSVQLCDDNTYNYGNIGSRTTGADAGDFMVTGPDWSGATPSGIKKVFQSGTQFSLAIFRTQLFEAGDLDNVKKVQAGYDARPLSAYLKQPAPEGAPPKNSQRRIGTTAYPNRCRQQKDTIARRLSDRKESGIANHAEHPKVGGALQGQDDAFDLKARLAEVEQQAEMQVRGFQIIQALRAVNLVDRLGYLQFDEHAVCDQQVNSIFPDLDPIVSNDHGMLLRDGEPRLAQLVHQCVFIDFLKEPSSQRSQ
jgi:hypothetical protein